MAPAGGRVAMCRTKPPQIPKHDIQAAYRDNGYNSYATARELGISVYFVRLAVLWIQRPKKGKLA